MFEAESRQAHEPHRAFSQAPNDRNGSVAKLPTTRGDSIQCPGSGRLSLVSRGSSNRRGELPSHLIADFDYPKRWADEFFLYGGEYEAGGQPFLKIELSYRNDAAERSVSIGYRFAQSVGPAGWVVDTHPTSFLPTAVCKAEGRGDRFFIAGWSTRTDRIVIEEWVIQGVVSVSEPTLGPDGGFLPPIMAPPAIAKEQVYSSPRESSVQPIEGLAYNPMSADLYVLMYGGLGQVYRLTIDQSPVQPQLFIDASAFQQLSGASGMRSFFHVERGLLIAVDDDPPWAPTVAGGYLAIGDTDLDDEPDTALIQYLYNSETPQYYSPQGWRRSWKVSQ